MRILGIDPGLQCTGFGVIDVEGSALRYVASGALLPQRLKTLFDGIGEVTRSYQPDVAACEIVFVNVNPQATLLLGQARGCCVTALVAHGLPVAEYTALQLKKAIAGHGRATKAQIQEMVRRLLRLPGLPGKDAADALGLAITHAQVSRTRDAHAGAHPRRLQVGTRVLSAARACAVRAGARAAARRRNPTPPARSTSG
jgi:crossover junction endodeoxyribonuclease RuvC